MMSNDATIIKSEVSDKAKIFRGCLVRNSKISENVLCADDVVVDRSVLAKNVEIGRRTYIQDSTFGFGSYIGQNSLVKFTNVGKFNSISWNVSIGGSNHNYNSPNMYTSYWWKKVFDECYPDEKEGMFGEIGNATWISAGVNIVRGVKIGDGAVIGAGAVVTQDVPPFAIAVGIPAKVIKYRYDAETIKVLNEIKWWNWPAEIIKKNSKVLHDDLTKENLEEMIRINNELKK